MITDSIYLLARCDSPRQRDLWSGKMNNPTDDATRLALMKKVEQHQTLSRLREDCVRKTLVASISYCKQGPDFH